jgi:DNA modification methylase
LLKLNKIYNINCLSGFKQLEDDSVNNVFTSPPYNRKRNDKYNFYNDDLVEYKQFIKEVIDESLRVSKDYVFLNIQKNYYNKTDVFSLIGEYADKLIDIFIWNKSNPMPASGHNVTNAYEFVLILSDVHTSIKSNQTYTKNLFTTNVYSNNPYKQIHRAVMNPEACEYILHNFTQENDIILDPFMGVGTTAVVCKEMNRRYIGFEINKEYHSVAEERLIS